MLAERLQHPHLHRAQAPSAAEHVSDRAGKARDAHVHLHRRTGKTGSNLRGGQRTAGPSPARAPRGPGAAPPGPPRACPPVLTATAFAVTMAPIASQSAGCSAWPRTTRPVSAATTGLTLMKTP